MRTVYYFQVLVACGLWLGSAAQARVVVQPLEYQADGVTLRGQLAYDDAMTSRRPGVVVFPEWWGLNEFPRERAEALAREGYVALAADMYGDGRTTKDPKQAGAWSGEVKNSALIRTRSRAALDTLAKQPQVDPQRLAAIGFCFGGTTALELAWSGAPIKAAVSFHGSLTVPGDADNQIKAAILVLHGANDDFESPQDIEKFQKTMRERSLDWTMIYYSGAVHAFMNPQAGAAGIKGVAYHPTAANRAWQHMQLLLEEKLR